MDEKIKKASNKALDRRTTGRIHCSFPLDFQIEGRQGFYHAQVVNISSDGLCMLPDTVLNPLEEINLFFPFKTGTLMVPAKVVRLDGREIALNFSHDMDAAEEFIQAFNDEYSRRAKSKFLKNCP